MTYFGPAQSLEKRAALPRRSPRSRQEPVLELPLTGAGSQRATSLAFNPKQRGLLGVGTCLSYFETWPPGVAGDRWDKPWGLWSYMDSTNQKS